MRKNAIRSLFLSMALCASALHAQMGGMGGGAPSGAVPPGLERPKFTDVFLESGGYTQQRASEGKVVLDVVITGNKGVDARHIYDKLKTRRDRIFDRHVMIQDVRSLYEMKTFADVKTKVEERGDGVVVTFQVEELDLIAGVLFHGNRGLNEQELRGRVGLSKGDAKNGIAIENAVRRLTEAYREKGFNQATVSAVVGTEENPDVVVFRINEGPLERITSIRIFGATIVSEARLKKIIKSRGSLYGLPRYWGNQLDVRQVEDDRIRLVEYYRNLGYFEAEVGKHIEYDESGEGAEITFYVDEGPQYVVDAIQVEGTRFVNGESLKSRMELKPGESFNQPKMRRDVQMIQDVYGEQGFLQIDVQPQPALSDEPGHLTLVYKIQEGDRFVASEIRVNILGDARTRQQVILNNVELRPGQLISMPAIHRSQRRLQSTGLFTTNPAEGRPPEIAVDFESAMENENY